MRKLATTDAARIGRPDGPAPDDAVDECHLSGTPEQLKHDMVGLLGKDQVLHRVSDWSGTPPVPAHADSAGSEGAWRHDLDEQRFGEKFTPSVTPSILPKAGREVA